MLIMCFSISRYRTQKRLRKYEQYVNDTGLGKMGLETVEKDKGNLVDGQSEFHNKHDVLMDQKEYRSSGVQQMEY